MEVHKLVIALGGEECHTKFRDVIDVESNLVETIANVYFEEVDRPKCGVCEEGFLQHSIEGMAELHQVCCHDG